MPHPAPHLAFDTSLQETGSPGRLHILGVCPCFLSSFLSLLFSILIRAYKARAHSKSNLALVHVTVAVAVVEFVFPFPDVRCALHVD